MDLHAALAEFARWAIREGSWQGCDLDGGSIQDKALELGLIVETTYDPDKHGDADADAGDRWYVFTPALARRE